ncbi:MAG: hypothetical protein ACR2GG_03020 [Gemmatimonadaceae bacterium]
MAELPRTSTAHAPPPHTATYAPKSKSSDFASALTGLVVGGCVLFALVFGIVEITNHMYSGESTGEATVQAAP